MKFRKASASDKKALRDIGQRIRQARKARGLRGADLAILTRLSQAQISRIESGLQSVRSTVLIRIAKAIKVSPIIFFMDAKLVERALKTSFASSVRGVSLLAPQRTGKNRGRR